MFSFVGSAQLYTGVVQYATHVVYSSVQSSFLNVIVYVFIVWLYVAVYT
nr:hypothetical protein [bacterium]